MTGLARNGDLIMACVVAMAAVLCRSVFDTTIKRG